MRLRLATLALAITLCAVSLPVKAETCVSPVTMARVMVMEAEGLHQASG